MRVVVRNKGVCGGVGVEEGEKASVSMGDAMQMRCRAGGDMLGTTYGGRGMQVLFPNESSRVPS